MSITTEHTFEHEPGLMDKQLYAFRNQQRDPIPDGPAAVVEYSPEED